MNSNGDQSKNGEGVKSLRMKYYPHLYESSCYVTRMDAIHFLEKYKDKIKWKHSGDRSIDLGCANGNVTSLLETYLPANFESLVGCDVNEKMVEVANLDHSNDRTSFKVFDIVGELTAEMINAYDHVFSFYTLNWIQKQEKAFQNIYNMLVPGGDCFLTFCAYHQIFSIYQALAAQDKWKNYLYNVDQFVSPYHDCEEPDSKVRELMEKIGFKDIEVKCKQKIHFLENTVFVDLILAVNPFEIPENLSNEFVEDIKKVIREIRLTRLNDKNVETVECRYNLLVCYAQK